MTPVFADTVGLIAIWDEEDQWHAQAQAAWNEVARQRTPVITTPYVLLECGNALARTPFRSNVDALRRQLENNSLLIHPNPDDWAQAWSMYVRGDAADAGIVDHFSFAIMRRCGVRDAFTNDRHFTAAGFNALF